MFNLKTPRLILRSLTGDDAGPTAALMTHEVSRWTGTWPADAAGDYARLRIDGARQAEAEGRMMMLALERLAEPGLIGWVGLTKAEPASREAVLGYWLGKAFQGQGFASEAAAAVIAAGWDTLRLDRVLAGAQSANDASLSVLRKLGFTYLGAADEYVPVRGTIERCDYFELERRV